MQSDQAETTTGRRAAGAEAYISGALSALAEGTLARLFYEVLGEIVAGEGLDPYIPHRYTDPVAATGIAPEAVYEIDRRHVAQAALVVAYAGVPSFGVGIEVEIAREHGVPVILVVERGRTVSRILLGNPAVAEVVRFDDLVGLRRSLGDAVRRMRSERRERPAEAASDDAVVRRFLRTLAESRGLPEAEVAALVRLAGIGPDLATAVRDAVAHDRLFAAGLRDLVGRYALRGEDLGLFLSRYVLGRPLPAGGRRRLEGVLARLGLASDDAAIAQWLVTELIVPPSRALQLQLFAPGGD